MASSLPGSRMEAESCAASPGTGDEFGRLSTQPEEGEADLVSDGSGQMIARPKGGTVSLTWEDLCVTVADEQHRCISILQGLTGCARPGEVLAIIGPSGCGKSTLLDALAGRLSRKTKRTGQILLNGRKEPLAYGTSGCVTQDDVLTWTLTVREAIYLSAQLQLPDSMPLLEKKQRADTTIKEMGLHDAIDTRIGGLGNRGLSNGQKRRLSIYLEISTRPKLLFLDEPRRGLMRRIVSLAEQNKMTVLASIHQPNSEVFELYKSLCLLSLGRTVYFGLSSEATQFFPLNGFPCPSLQNPSDHYLRTINTDFDEDIEQGFGGKQSTEGVIKLLVDRTVLDKKGQACFFTQFPVLTRRSFINMYRDPGYYWMRLIIYIALGFGLGTVFYDIGSGYSSIQARGSMLMFVASFLTILAIRGFSSFVEDLKVFERERLNGHYRTSAFVLGNALSSMPFLLIISLIPRAITYYLAGLQKSLEHFIYFASTLFTCMILMESLMMIVASVMPNFLMGLITGAGIQGLMILGGGFFRLPSDLPKVLCRYPLYYLSFHKYAYQGLYNNEFEGLTLPRNPLIGERSISGKDLLRDIWQVEMGYSKWTNLAILLGIVVLYRLIFFGVLKMTEKFKPAIGEIMLALRTVLRNIEYRPWQLILMYFFINILAIIAILSFSIRIVKVSVRVT